MGQVNYDATLSFVKCVATRGLTIGTISFSFEGLWRKRDLQMMQLIMIVIIKSVHERLLMNAFMICNSRQILV